MESQVDKKSILIVDDNPENIHILLNILKEKYSLLVALNGKDALGIVMSDKKIDLILLDVMMPVMDGFAACNEIKRIENKKDIPIIFLTAKTDVDSLSMAFSTGGVDYITKPFNNLELLTRIDTHLSLKESQDKLKSMNNWLREEVAKQTRELVESNRKLKIAKKELEDLDKAKGEFLNVISHEIRTPLNGIIGSCSLLRELHESDETLVFFNMLEDSINRLEQFSLKTLDVTYLRTKKDALKFEQDLVSNIIETSKNNLSEKIRNKSIKLNIENSLAEGTIFLNKEYLVKCIDNILDNAIKNSPKESDININLKQDERISIKISDNGNGFDEQFLAQPLSLFHTNGVQTELSPGLGLYLSKLVVDAHKGELHFGNNKEKGAFVEIII